MLGQLDLQLSSFIVSSIKRIHGVFCISFVVISNESEASVVFAVFLSRDVDVSNLTILLEQVIQIIHCGSGGYSIHFDACHSVCVIRDPVEFGHFYKYLSGLVLK